MSESNNNFGTLYIVATPIGNLSDFTLRAKQVFTEVDFIAAEDTRVTVKLLNHLGIKKQLISYYEHNLKQRGEVILNRIINGESCALCSDAGTPAISDPGELIVKQAHELGIKVVPIPGACAAITALCASGQVTGSFVFLGFLPTNRRIKKQRLAQLKAEEKTVILYESPHKLLTTLKDLCEFLGEDRSITICRELTKIYEEIFVTTTGNALNIYTEKKPKGEFVIIISALENIPQETEYTLQQAAELALSYINNNESTSSAAKKAAAETGFPKSDIYKLIQKSK